jgi:hypothetical protein
MAMAGAIMIGGFGFVWGGLSSLESVDPGSEPYAADASGEAAPEGSGWISPERDQRDERSA